MQDATQRTAFLVLCSITAFRVATFLELAITSPTALHGYSGHEKPPIQSMGSQ